MFTWPCTNPQGCRGTMDDFGNYFFCRNCGALEFKLPEADKPWKPLPKQETTLYNTNKFFLYVGGVGSGKTMVGSYKAIFKALQHPNGMGLIGAQTFPQLRDATMETFFMVCPEKLMHGGSKAKAFNKSDGILTMYNGHKILFRPLDDESKLRSLNLVWFWIDESSEVPGGENIFFQLQSRLRSLHGFVDGPDGKVPVHQGWNTTNPNGKDWQYKLFVLSNDPDYAYVNAPTRENKYLPPGFEEGLRRRWPDQWVRRFLEGSFDAFEGQIYPDLNPDIHANLHAVMDSFHVEHFENDTHQIPEGWPVFVALDHGITNPTAIGFFTLTPEERVVMFDELYENGKPVSYHAQKIREKLESWGRKVEHVEDWLIDPSAVGQRGMEGRAVIDVYHDYGIPFRKANNQVQAGILQTVEYLMPDLDERPRFVIHRRCGHSWEEMTGYRWKKKTGILDLNEPEEPTKKDDHTCDMIRYFLMTRPKVTLLKATNPYHLAMAKRQAFAIDPKKIPFALRTEDRNARIKWPNWN